VKPFLLHQHKPQWLNGFFLPVLSSDCFSKGNLLGSLIEPETSIKKNWAGRLSVGIFFALTIFNNWCFDSGQSLYSVVIENGFWSCGCGFFVLEKIDHFFSHGIFRHGLSVVDKACGWLSAINREVESGADFGLSIDFLQNFIVFL
jgi:hypothetical protein